MGWDGVVAAPTDGLHVMVKMAGRLEMRGVACFVMLAANTRINARRVDSKTYTDIDTQSTTKPSVTACLSMPHFPAMLRAQSDLACRVTNS